MLHNSDLGNILKENRLIEGFTQTELARASGLSKSYISRIERGVAFPTPQSLSQIAKPLALDKRDLLLYAACAVLNSTSYIDDTILDGILMALKGLKSESRKQYPVLS